MLESHEEVDAMLAAITSRMDKASELLAEAIVYLHEGHAYAEADLPRCAMLIQHLIDVAETVKMGADGISEASKEG